VITLRETLISIFNRLCRARPRTRAHATCRWRRVRGTHALCNHAGLPGCARAPMVRIPKVKDSLSNRSGRRRRLFSFRHVPRLLSLSLSHVLSRLSSFSNRSFVAEKSAYDLANRPEYPPLYNTLDRRAIASQTSDSR